MTDFLNHLVTRSLHPETSLQPRPVSRFEQGLDPSPVEPSPAREINEEHPPTPPAMPVPRPLLPREEFTPPSEPHPLAQQTISTPSLTSPLPAPPAEPTPTPHRGRLDAPERVETLLRTQTIRERVIERPIHSPPVPAPIESTPPTILTKKEPLRSVISSSAAHILPTPQVSPRITPTIRPNLPVVIPTHKAPDLAPTIHVTIGRVEVRATPASAPTPSRPAKTPSVMTLDEYLLRKNTGGEP